MGQQSGYYTVRLVVVCQEQNILRMYVELLKHSIILGMQSLQHHNVIFIYKTTIMKQEL